MDQSVTATGPGSVEQFRQRMRRFVAGTEGLDAFAVGTIEAIISDLHAEDVEKVRQIRNVLIAAGRIRAERAADPLGQLYSRADDEGPAEDMTVHPRRIEPHNGGVTNGGGLVDETPPVACHTCGGAAQVIDGELVHVGADGQRAFPAHPHDAWVG